MRQGPGFWLAASAINGFIAVAMGAFAAHGLQPILEPEALRWVETASTYQMWHALALLGVAALTDRAADIVRPTALRLAGWCFLVGILLFAGSLDLAAVTDWRGLVWLVPVGGAALLFGWLALAWHAITLWRTA